MLGKQRSEEKVVHRLWVYWIVGYLPCIHSLLPFLLTKISISFHGFSLPLCNLREC